MKLDSIITPELALLESLQRGTDPLTRKNLQVMHENFVVPYSQWLKGQYTLLEAEMTADQITQAFGYAEKIATAGGDNRSMLGKGADVVGAGAKGAADLAVKGAKGAKDLAAKLVPQAVKDKFTKSLPPADAGPVAGFEQKATQAIAGIQDPKAKQSLMDKIKIGLQNPATQQLIMVGVSGIAGVIASTATAGIGGYAGAAAAGAITGSLLGAINAKMQGKSWADTGKAALKGAALGAAGGLIGKGVADAGSAAIDAVKGSNAPTGPAGAPGAQDDATGVDAAVQKNATDDWQKLAQKADGLALAASGNSTNPDGTASPAMAKYMQAQADSQAAYNKINPTDGYNAPDPSAPAGGGMQNFDGSAMTNAQMSANMDRVAPVAGGANDPNKYYNSLSADQQRATDDSIVAQANQASGTPHTTADGQVIPPGASRQGNTIYNNSDPADPNVMADIKTKQDYYKNDPAGQAEYAKIMAPDRISDGPSAPINANAGQQQVDLNNMVQNKIDTGAIPAPQGATPADTGTSAAPATGFKEVTPQGDVVGQLKDLVGQGYQVQRSQTDPGSIAVFDKDGNPMQTLKVGGFNASRMSAAANGILLRSGHSPVPAINENVDYELTARMWALRNRVGKPYSKIHMTEAAIRRAFEMAASSQLNEGPMDWIKKKAGQAADFVKTKVGNVTNKITADKLQQAWTKAGSPTDSVEVGKIMAANGVPQDSVDQILKNMGVPNAPAAPAQAGADAGGTTPPTQDPAQAGGATPPAKAGGRDIPVDPSSVAPPDAKQGAGGAPTPTPTAQADTPDANGAITTRLDNPGNNNAPAGFFNPNGPKTGASTPPTQAQAGGTSTPPTNKEIAQGAIAKAQDSSKGGSGPTNVTGTIQKGAEELQGITGAIKAGQGMGTSGTSLMQPRDGSSTASEVKIKDEKGQEHAYKKVGQKWYDKDNKEVPPAIAAMLDKQAQQQAALGKDKNAAPLAGPQGEIPGAKPPVPAKPGATPPATAGATAPAPAKQEPVKIGGQTLDPKNPADKKIIDQVQAQQGAAQTPPAATPATSATAQQPGATPPAKPGALDPRDLNKDGTVDATEKSIARNQAKTGAKPPAATTAPGATAATPPAATTAPASQSPEDIRKAKQADAAKAAQAQMTAKPAPAATAEPVPGETPAQTAAKAHTGGKVAGQLSQTPNAIRKRDARAATAQAKTTGNDVMGRMAKQLGGAPAGGPAQAEPTATPAATPDFSKTMTGYGKTTTNAPTGVPSVAKPAVPAATNATTEPAAVAPKAKRSVTGDVPVPDNFGKQPEMAGIDFSAVLLRKMKQIV